VLNATLKSLMAHKLRLALTALAVVLGVMFMAGTFVLTDTIKHSINGLVNQGTAGKNVIVRGISPFSSGGLSGSQDNLSGNNRPLVPQSLLAAVKGVPGVAIADGQVQGTVSIVDAKGKALGPQGGAPTVALTWLPDRKLSLLVLHSGREPQKAGEVALDNKTATSKKVKLGDTITVTGNLGPQPSTVVGTMRFGTQDTIAGASLVAFDTATAQAVAGRLGFFTEIDIGASPGVTTDPLVSRVGAIMPPHYEAVSAAQAASETAAGFDSFFNLFNTFLLVFAVIALLVGAFLIFNTFTILIGQRTRELALLRAVGAGRGQVLTSVMGEALLTGLFGSAVGLGLGIALAYGLYRILKSSLSLSATSLQILPRTIIISLAAGTLITVFSAVLPAMRASRIPPVAAMRDDVVVSEGSLRRRAIFGVFLLAAGIAGLVVGLVGKTLLAVGLGSLVIFLGVAMLVPLIASPMSRIIGAPLPVIQGVSGRLGRANSARNPRRTAATASALMIGIAVVAAIATLVGSLLGSFNGIFDRSFQANYVVSTNTGEPFPAGPAEAAVQAAPGVTAMSGFAQAMVHLKGASKSLSGIDPVQGPQVFRITMTKGSLAPLAQGQLLVDETTSTGDHVQVGDRLTMTFATTGDQTLRVAGVFQDNQLLGSYVTSNALIAANTNSVRDAVVLVKTSSTTPAVHDGLKKAVAGFPQLKVRTGAQFKADQKKAIKGFLYFIYALVALSIIIAMVGVINTLALSVLERTREIGLVRAVGMQRRQVRRMIRGEAVVVSVLGAILGLALGVALGAALVSTISGTGAGITQVVIPVATIVEVLIAVFIFAILAALFPASRASKLDVLKAITSV
jgi:putative ABC transport system permease protein